MLPPVAVVGCHGGCGSTTLARLLAPAAREVQRDQLHTGDDPLLLVARGTAYGMHWATRGVACAHQNIASGWLAAPPLLVLVADSTLREPQTVRARLRLVQDRVRAVVRVPYVPAWRDTDDPLSVPPTRPLTEALAALRSAVAVRTA
ncbi:hypothetical protein DVA86_20365 [Streptomyces armeniacus]|uniref:ATP/GTP-binding protein n=1 Tax=Streptomyces armeniacus TaxID=83291 RepID=A0A345XSN4_9ACTN|nr:hypothetical protein DVA86_20365 [Streptomyces armeniacus]